MPDFVHVARIELDYSIRESMDAGLDRVLRKSSEQSPLLHLWNLHQGRKSDARLLEEIGR